MKTITQSSKKSIRSIKIKCDGKTCTLDPEAFGHIMQHQDGVMIKFPDGELLVWLKVEDEVRAEKLVDELDKVMEARDENRYYKPDFSFLEDKAKAKVVNG